MCGSITELVTHAGYGRLLGEDGCELYFDETSLDGMDMRSVSIGDWVEYQEQNCGGRIRVLKVRPIPGPGWVPVTIGL
jgi:hypothetical protein